MTGRSLEPQRRSGNRWERPASPIEAPPPELSVGPLQTPRQEQEVVQRQTRKQAGMTEGLTSPRRGERPRGVKNWIFRGAAANTDEQSDGKVGQTGTK